MTPLHGYTEPVYTFTARKEILLSAGAIGTPQLLLLSGIGNRTRLEQEPLSIATVLDLPDVGQHMQDHPQIANFFLVNSNSTFDDVLRSTSLANEWLTEWEAKREGLYVDSRSSMIGFIRLAEDSRILKTFGDPTAGNGSGHIEFLFAVSFRLANSPHF